MGEETSSAPLNQDDISEGSRGNRIGTVSVSGGKGAACTSCENAFPRFLEAIEVDEGNAQYASVDGVLFSKDLKKLIRYPGYAGDQYSIPEGTECIAQEAFSGCYLKQLTLPASIKTIERNAFRGMSGLEEMDCQSEDIALGTGLFSESKLDQIDWWPWDSITKAAFMNSSIEHIRIPEGVEAIEDYAFAGCRYVREITVSEGVKSIERNSFRLGMGCVK